MSSKHTVQINALRLRGFHGVFKEENEIGNTLEFNLSVQLDFSESMNSDQLSATVDYVGLLELIKEENKQTSKTLEHLGGRIIRRIFEQFNIAKSVWIKIEKINPPLTDELRSIGIEIEESR